MAELMTQARHATLLDLLDRLLGKGVVAYGDVILAIADLDLVYLNLRAVLSAIGTLEKYEKVRVPAGGGSLPAGWQAGASGGGSSASNEQSELSSHGGASAPLDTPRIKATFDDSLEKTSRLQKMAEELGSELSKAGPTDSKTHPPGARRLELDPQKVEQGLAKLVLTLINLLRKLMERQAIRRMEQGTLTEAQMERSGQAFKRLDQKMEELKKQFGLADEDLNLDLGPLGELM